MGEVLDQLDLLVGERAHLHAVDRNCADQLTLLQHGDFDQCADAGDLDRGH
jgi:hypothetical protein